MIPILLSALMLTGCAGQSNHKVNTYRQITMDEAVEMMAEERGYIILDVRRPNEADSPAKIARCKQMLAILLNKVDSLEF